MNNTLIMEKVEKIASFNGIDVYHIKTEKFKTSTINIFFHDELRRDTVTRNALLPAVLRRGCEKFPTFQEIALYLEELYGAAFDCGVAKKGERQIIQFYIDFVSDQYTGGNAKLFEKSMELLLEIILKPVLKDGTFRVDYLEQEKENLRKLIEGRVNDKNQYAVDKCFEEMCSNEPFGVYEYGLVEDLKDIDASGLYSYYLDFVRTLPISVFVTGDIPAEKTEWMLEKLKQFPRAEVKKLKTHTVKKEIAQVRDVVEKMNVSQGKLSLGFRTNTAPDEESYYKLLVYNGILGGGVHSKLFQNVREKASLAYYAFSRLEKFKGLMVVSSGIEINNKDKAMKIMLEQMEEIKKGNISDEEYESTLKSIENGMRSLKDSQLHMVDFYLSQSVAGTVETMDHVVEKVKSVSKEDVVEIAGRILLDTVYFLTSTNEQLSNDGSAIDKP